MCVTPPFWPHLATPADVALALWPQSRQCGWRANHRGMCPSVLGEEGLVGSERDIILRLPPHSQLQWVPGAIFNHEGRPSADLVPAVVTLIQCRLPGEIQAHRLHWVWEPLLPQSLAPLSAPSPNSFSTPDGDGSGGLGRGLLTRAEILATIRMVGSFLLQASVGVGLLFTGKSSQLPVASLGWSGESKGFLWRKKWKRNMMGWPCLSHFLLPGQWVVCLPFPAGVRRLCGVWAGLGAPCWLGVCLVALATTEQWWGVTFSDQRTVYRDQDLSFP